MKGKWSVRFVFGLNSGKKKEHCECKEESAKQTKRVPTLTADTFRNCFITFQALIAVKRDRAQAALPSRRRRRRLLFYPIQQNHLRFYFVVVVVQLHSIPPKNPLV